MTTVAPTAQRVPAHRAVARVASFVYLGIAGAMALCALLGWLFQRFLLEIRPIDQGGVAEMLGSAAIVAVVGSLVFAWGRPAGGLQLSRRHATLAVSAIWFGAALLGAVPYIVGAQMAWFDAMFESASGFTTTGATVVADVEGTLSHSVMLWRSFSQWLGGMGIVVLFVAVFPSLGVGGKHMYRHEAPGHVAEGLQPRIAETGLMLWRIYMVLTVAAAGALWASGMNLFEALNHSWTLISTAGFSTRNDSIGSFDSAQLEWVVIGFMALSGVSFTLYYQALVTRRVSGLLKSLELRVYLAILVGSSVLIAAAILPLHGNGALDALRHATFTVTAMLTSTGYGIDAYMAYPSWAVLLLVCLMFIGGMSGSTAGGMKVSRFVILAETAWVMIRRSVRPNVVQVVRLDGRAIDDEMLLDVAALFFVFMALMAGGTMAVSFTDGVTVPTAFGAMLSALANMGPAPFHVGADNFASYSAPAKVLFAVAMVVGRLEILSVLALFLPELWRR